MRINPNAPLFRRFLWAFGLSTALVHLIIQKQGFFWLEAAVKPMPILCLVLWTDTLGRGFDRC